jgi:hypothetical protein
MDHAKEWLNDAASAIGTPVEMNTSLPGNFITKRIQHFD